MTRKLTIFAAVAALAISAGTASAANPPAQSLAYTLNNTMISGYSLNDVHQTNGIIMRDGGICDPIRHMGC